MIQEGARRGADDILQGGPPTVLDTQTKTRTKTRSVKELDPVGLALLGWRLTATKLGPKKIGEVAHLLASFPAESRKMQANNARMAMDVTVALPWNIIRDVSSRCLQQIEAGSCPCCQGCLLERISSDRQRPLALLAAAWCCTLMLPDLLDTSAPLPLQKSQAKPAFHGMQLSAMIKRFTI